MPLPGQFCRVSVHAGTEASDQGYELYVRHDQAGSTESRAFARFVCCDVELLRAVLETLRVDAVSRFVRETEDGPIFECVPADFMELMRLIGRLSPSGSKSITLVASDLSEAETLARIEEVKAILGRPNNAMEPTARN